MVSPTRISVLGPLLFVIFVNDLHESVKQSQILYFADDTNLLYTIKSLWKKKSTNINKSSALLIVQWLRLNKINLNADKTEITIFRSKWKQITKYLNFWMSPSDHAKKLMFPIK